MISKVFFTENELRITRQFYTSFIDVEILIFLKMFCELDIFRSRRDTTITSCKEAKSENLVKTFLWFLTLNFRPTKETRDCAISKEKHCCHGGLPSPKKRLSYKKCFILQLVDSKVNPKFKVLSVFWWSINVQNVIHIDKIRWRYKFLGSLTYLGVCSSLILVWWVPWKSTK